MLKFANTRIFYCHSLASVRKYVYLCVVINKQTYNKLNITIMSTTFKNTMREVMTDAWRMFRITGESFAACLKRAWQLAKLAKAMKTKVVQFFYVKASTGELRQAFGTLQASVIDGLVKGTGRKANENLMTYYDQEAQGFRSFKKFNLVKVIL